MWRIAKNKWNRNAPPWTDAIAIEDIGDPFLAVPPIVCWMTRGGGQQQNAELIVAAVNAVKMAAAAFSEAQVGEDE